MAYVRHDRFNARRNVERMLKEGLNGGLFSAENYRKRKGKSTRTGTTLHLKNIVKGNEEQKMKVFRMEKCSSTDLTRRQG